MRLYAFVCVHVCFCVSEHVLSNSCQNNRAVLVEPADVCQLWERPTVTFLCSRTFLCFLCSFLPPAAASYTLPCLFVCLSSVSFLLSFFLSHIFISFCQERVWFPQPPCLKHKAQTYPSTLLPFTKVPLWVDLKCLIFRVCDAGIAEVIVFFLSFLLEQKTSFSVTSRWHNCLCR